MVVPACRATFVARPAGRPQHVAGQHHPGRDVASLDDWGDRQPGPVQRPWMELVARLAQRSLLNKAKTWYLGANVKDKPLGLTLFTGGFPKYREYCAAAAQAGYRDLVFERSRTPVAV